MSSLLKRLFKQAPAALYFWDKQYKTAEEIGIDVAAQRVLRSTHFMIERAQRRSLKRTVKKFTLKTLMSEEGEENLKTMSKTIIDHCYNRNVKLEYKVHEGVSQSLADIASHYLRVIFCEMSDPTMANSRKYRNRNISLVPSK